MDQVNVNPQDILDTAILIHDERVINQALDRLATEIGTVLADAAPLVLCVMGGGVVFAGQLLPRLSFPLEFDYVQASRYHNRTEGMHLEWKVKPGENVRGRTVLVLDDILDEGYTLIEIKQQCLHLGAKEVLLAVLVEKDLGRSKPITADFIGLTVPNQYVFGCGMDVYGWWRNLPAIYALRSEVS
ncbi:hypoxanthine-guanine phosphoribosyltransferase [Methylobacillus gramineus]|uniref:hypoxanthine-guanine phosphoribosyltransferase n=1 Tax=Methylobacillus gramineus TaxID=755169 RepID=UPI001CFF5AEC|nr:hypoxanthine-guanine phosphoribosyltransferase [Methylobacillus gramineus]MCB5184135.1 hypoxanthine-guanine phosphoribosyltransferase [Methylobacillus gramineus]